MSVTTEKEREYNRKWAKKDFDKRKEERKMINSMPLKDRDIYLIQKIQEKYGVTI